MDAKRKQAEQEKRKPKYDGTCRDRQDVPADRPCVVRFAPAGRRNHLS
ncbi:MAG: hypothetical protein R2864_11390 [Syntrophotaleaceae bacterium]